ncbi:hypothetical protein PUR_11490 [Paenibacillus sp. URB8-2]|nr:hypothetical protein PUR_11490 [Paenibacillus sp. URB8-2]
MPGCCKTIHNFHPEKIKWKRFKISIETFPNPCYDSAIKEVEAEEDTWPVSKM